MIINQKYLKVYISSGITKQINKTIQYLNNIFLFK